MIKNFPKVLSIAGSDPSGGAGIEADIKTLTSLRVYILSIISSITVQNTKGVFEKYDIPSKIIEKQLEKLVEDIDFDFVKISMIGDKKNIKIFKKFLSGKFIIFDPVLYSKNAFPLIDEEYQQIVCEDLIPLCKIITPNYPELKILSGYQSENPELIALKLLERYKNLEAVLIKGGHINENSLKVMDKLILKENKKITFVHSRINTPNLHGTGCTLASAIAAYLAKGNDIETSTKRAVNYLNRIIKKSKNYKIGKGNGPLLHYL